jgi:drug/metabolite transporter (DMT)-like permease
MSDAAVTAEGLEDISRQGRRFLFKGIGIAIWSGVLYGLYTAFVSQAGQTGPWFVWISPDSVLGPFIQIYVLGMLACALNDSLSALWAVGWLAVKGKLGDLGRSLLSKPGLVMVICALIGGPVANGAYLIAVRLAGPAAAPITALCPVVGALIGRVMFKQRINARMATGIGICLVASLMIGSTSLGGDAPSGMAFGLVIALFAAVGWGIEGAVAGYGTVLIDYQIGITIRQLTAGFLNMAFFVPVLCIMAGGNGLFGSLLGQALASPAAMALFAVSGLFSFLSFGLWYRGNAMCGTALGMACNGSYSFWTPLFCWLVIGVGFGLPGWNVSTIVWWAAPIMFIGLTLVAVNPLEMFRHRSGSFGMSNASDLATPSASAKAELSVTTDDAAYLPVASDDAAYFLKSNCSDWLPINYALLLYVAETGQATADDLLIALNSRYGSSRAFRREYIADALAAAEKNGVLAINSIRLNSAGALAVQYRPTDHGKAMIRRFITLRVPVRRTA